MNIIGIHGKKGSGKDTASKLMQTELGGSKYAVILHFATPLKKACSAMFSVNMDWFNDRDLKEVVIPEWGMSPRQMMTSMQDILKIQYGEDIFVKTMIKKCKQIATTQHHTVIIADVRFAIEAEWIHSLGGSIIHLDRRGLLPCSHISEAGLPVDLVLDIEVDNNYSKVDLLFKLLRAMRLKHCIPDLLNNNLTNV